MRVARRAHGGVNGMLTGAMHGFTVNDGENEQASTPGVIRHLLCAAAGRRAGVWVRAVECTSSVRGWTGM